MDIFKIVSVSFKLSATLCVCAAFGFVVSLIFVFVLSLLFAGNESDKWIAWYLGHPYVMLGCVLTIGCVLWPHARRLSLS